MCTFEPISNKHLLVEVVRRLRTRHVMSGGRSAPDGTHLDKVLCALSETGVMSRQDVKSILIEMLEKGEIVLYGSSSFREAGMNRLSMYKNGVITRLHPDSKFACRQYFTPSGTPIIPRRSNEGNLLYPNDTVSYRTLTFRQIYIVSDGLPRSVQPLLKGDPVQPY